MTIDDFLVEFAAIVKEITWKLERDRIIGIKVISGREHRCCPATAHYGKYCNLGIIDIQREIIKAADLHEDFDPKLRLSLLSLCGIVRV
jgi:hypothetical protein